jgi:PilZ domain-containing protein
VGDHRTAQRQRTYKGGRIHLRHASTIDCLVRNLSDAGASLEIESPVGIPDAFEISIAGEDRPRRCRVAWRKERRIGVKFA